jgi:hypothetical protein
MIKLVPIARLLLMARPRPIHLSLDREGRWPCSPSNDPGRESCRLKTSFEPIAEGAASALCSRDKSVSKARPIEVAKFACNRVLALVGWACFIAMMM